MAETRNALRADARKGLTRLHIGAQSTIARTVFGGMGAALRQRFPSAKLRRVEALAGQILDQLANGDIDFA